MLTVGKVSALTMIEIEEETGVYLLSGIEANNHVWFKKKSHVLY